MQVRQSVCLYSSTEPRGRVIVNTVQYSEGPSFKSRPRDETRVAVVDVVVQGPAEIPDDFAKQF